MAADGWKWLKKFTPLEFSSLLFLPHPLKKSVNSYASYPYPIISDFEGPTHKRISDVGKPTLGFRKLSNFIKPFVPKSFNSLPHRGNSVC